MASRPKNPVTLARIIGLAITPSGVILAAWAIEEMMRGGPDRLSWIAITLGAGISLSMIIVGVRYLLKPPGGVEDAGGDDAGG